MNSQVMRNKEIDGTYVDELPSGVEQGSNGRLTIGVYSSALDSVYLTSQIYVRTKEELTFRGPMSIDL